MSQLVDSSVTFLRAGVRGALGTAAALAVGCAVASVAAAQAPHRQNVGVLSEPALAKGMPVRVVVPATNGQPETRISGTLFRLQGDTVTIGVGQSGASRSIALNGGWRLEAVARGASHGGAGAAVGAIAGALAGAGIAVATWHRCSGLECIGYFSTTQQALIGAGIGVPCGALLGFILGRAIRTEEWVPVETAGVRIALGLGGLSASIGF